MQHAVKKIKSFSWLDYNYKQNSQLWQHLFNGQDNWSKSIPESWSILGSAAAKVMAVAEAPTGVLRHAQLQSVIMSFLLLKQQFQSTESKNC